MDQLHCIWSALAISPDSRQIAISTDLWDSELVTESPSSAISIESGTVAHVQRNVPRPAPASRIQLWEVETGERLLDCKVKHAVKRLTLGIQGVQVKRFTIDCGKVKLPEHLHVCCCPAEEPRRRPSARSEIRANFAWITYRGQELLWLPPDYRATCSDIHGECVALGHDSGRVTVIELALGAT